MLVKRENMMQFSFTSFVNFHWLPISEFIPSSNNNRNYCTGSRGLKSKL